MTAQHMVALAKANTVRLEAAEVRRELAVGAITLGDALHDERAAVMTVERLLAAQRRWSPLRAQRLLGPMHISTARRVRDLTDRQRGALLQLAANPKETTA